MILLASLIPYYPQESACLDAANGDASQQTGVRSALHVSERILIFCHMLQDIQLVSASGKLHFHCLTNGLAVHTMDAKQALHASRDTRCTWAYYFQHVQKHQIKRWHRPCQTRASCTRRLCWYRVILVEMGSRQNGQA